MDPLWSVHDFWGYLQYLSAWHIEYRARWRCRSCPNCFRWWQLCTHPSCSPPCPPSCVDVVGKVDLWWHTTPPPRPCPDNCTPVWSDKFCSPASSWCPESSPRFALRIRSENELHISPAPPRCGHRACLPLLVVDSWWKRMRWQQDGVQQRSMITKYKQCRCYSKCVCGVTQPVGMNVRVRMKWAQFGNARLWSPLVGNVQSITKMLNKHRKLVYVLPQETKVMLPSY